MAWTPEQSRALAAFLASTAGGAGVGALAERAARGKWGWLGPASGSVAGGAGYLALDKPGRESLYAAVRDLATYRQRQREAQRAEKATAMSEQVLAQYADRTGYPLDTVRKQVADHYQEFKQLPTPRQLEARLNVFGKGNLGQAAQGAAGELLSTLDPRQLPATAVTGVAALGTSLIPGAGYLGGAAIGKALPYVAWTEKILPAARAAYGAGRLERQALDEIESAVAGGPESLNRYMARESGSTGMAALQVAVSPYLGSFGAAIAFPAERVARGVSVARTLGRGLNPAVMAAGALAPGERGAGGKRVAGTGGPAADDRKAALQFMKDVGAGWRGMLTGRPPELKGEAAKEDFGQPDLEDVRQLYRNTGSERIKGKLRELFPGVERW